MQDALKKFGVAVLAALTGLSLIGVMASLVFLVDRMFTGGGH